MPPVFALPWALAVLDAILAARMLRARAAAADASEELCCDAKDRDCVRCTFVNAVRGPGTNPVRVDVDTPPSIHDAVWKHTGGLFAAAVGGGTRAAVAKRRAPCRNMPRAPRAPRSGWRRGHVDATSLHSTLIFATRAKKRRKSSSRFCSVGASAAAGRALSTARGRVEAHLGFLSVAMVMEETGACACPLNVTGLLLCPLACDSAPNLETPITCFGNERLSCCSVVPCLTSTRFLSFASQAHLQTRRGVRCPAWLRLRVSPRRRPRLRLRRENQYN